MDAMLRGLGSVAERAAMELGKEAWERSREPSVLFLLHAKATQATGDEIAQHAVKLNVFATMNFMLQQAG